MIHDIMEVFLANLDKLEWMDDVTKDKAREKVGTTSQPQRQHLIITSLTDIQKLINNSYAH